MRDYPITRNARYVSIEREGEGYKVIVERREPAERFFVRGQVEHKFVTTTFTEHWYFDSEATRLKIETIKRYHCVDTYEVVKTGSCYKLREKLTGRMFTRKNPTTGVIEEPTFKSIQGAVKAGKA